MIIDNIKNSKLYFSVNNNFKKAFEFIEKAVNDNFEVGKYEIDGDKVYALVQEYETKTHNDTKFEGHKKYIDIQYIIEGTEYIEIADIDGMEPFTVYDDDKDFTLYSDGKEIVQKCPEQAKEREKPGRVVFGKRVG